REAPDHGVNPRAAELRPQTTVTIIEPSGGVRRRDRFMQALLACECAARARRGHEDDDYPQAQRFLTALTAVRAVDAGAIAKACEDPARIPQRVHEARVAAVAAALGK